MRDHVHLFGPQRFRHLPRPARRQVEGAASRTLCDEFTHLRSRLPTLWSGSYLVASVGWASETMIRRYIDEEAIRPTKGVP